MLTSCNIHYGSSLYIDGGQRRECAARWTNWADLSTTPSVIAVNSSAERDYGWILLHLSVGFVSGEESWKCVRDDSSIPWNWIDTGYDDYDWPQAVVVTDPDGKGPRDDQSNPTDIIPHTAEMIWWDNGDDTRAPGYCRGTVGVYSYYTNLLVLLQEDTEVDVLLVEISVAFSLPNKTNVKFYSIATEKTCAIMPLCQFIPLPHNNNKMAGKCMPKFVR